MVKLPCGFSALKEVSLNQSIYFQHLQKLALLQTIAWRPDGKEYFGGGPQYWYFCGSDDLLGGYFTAFTQTRSFTLYIFHFLGPQFSYSQKFLVRRGTMQFIDFKDCVTEKWCISYRSRQKYLEQLVSSCSMCDLLGNMASVTVDLVNWHGSLEAEEGVNRIGKRMRIKHLLLGPIETSRRSRKLSSFDQLLYR